MIRSRLGSLTPRVISWAVQRSQRRRHSVSKVRATPAREGASSDRPTPGRGEAVWRRSRAAPHRYNGTGLWQPSVHSDVAF
jgi:hypothetical protein